MNLGKHAGSIALIAAAATLAAYVLVVDKDKVTDVERAARPKNVFPAFRRDEVSRVVLASERERLVFDRAIAGDAAERDWHMSSPRSDEVDPSEADKLLGALEFASFVRRVETGAASAQPARVRGALTMGKLTLEFQLGPPAPTPEGASYFTVTGEGTFVVSKELVTQLLRSADDYRNKSFVPYLSLDLARLEVTGPTGHYAIDRIDDVAFKFADTGLRVSREKLDRVWLALGEMRADSFFPDADDRHPAFVVRMQPKDGKKPVGELAVLGECPGIANDVLVVRRAPTRLVACVPKVVLAGLSTTAAELLDTKLLSAREDEIESLALTTIPSGVAVDLARKGSGWRLRSPDDRDLVGDETETTGALVAAIAAGFGADVSRTNHCAITSRLRITRAESQVVESVDVGTCADGSRVAVRAVDGARIVLPAALARKLVPRVSSLRGRAVFPMTIRAGEVSRLSLRCGVAQDLSRSAAVFALDAPTGYAVDQAAAVDVLDVLLRARADAWVSDLDEAGFGLSSSACAASIALSGDAGTRVFYMRLGNEGEGGVYARLDDSRGSPSPVFVVSSAVRNAASRILIDRGALSVDASRAESLTVTQAGRVVTFTRSAGRLVLADGGVPSNRAELMSAFAELRADEVVHLGPATAAEGFDAPRLVITGSVDRGAGMRPLRITFGRASTLAHQNMLFARVAGIDATFAVAEDRVGRLALAL